MKILGCQIHLPTNYCCIQLVGVPFHNNYMCINCFLVNICIGVNVSAFVKPIDIPVMSMC